jgi:hypothetical protein
MKKQTWLILLAPVLLAGCQTMQSHNDTATMVKASGAAGDFKAAIAQLDQRNPSPENKKELLYNMERGELLRLDRQYGQSTDAFLLADEKVSAWEEAAKTDPSKLFGLVGASLISERLKPYEGQDYEKVWLTTRLALNRIAENDWDNARVDIKRTHEREAVIAELRSKETQAAEEEAKAKGAQVSNKEINGYPVESLNDPEVLKLKNGYQNALSHYLAGFLYEVLNEGGLAAPGYRKAIELKPDTAVLNEGLRGLDDRTSFTHRRRQRMTDVLFVLESGNAPARKPKNFTLPVSHLGPPQFHQHLLPGDRAQPADRPGPPDRGRRDDGSGRGGRPERDGAPRPQGRTARHDGARRGARCRQGRDAERTGQAGRPAGQRDRRGGGRGHRTGRRPHLAHPAGASLCCPRSFAAGRTQGDSRWS